MALTYGSGQSWKTILTLDTVGYQDQKEAEDVCEIYYQIPDLGYPATVELADGALHSVWYKSRPDGSDSMICGYRWKLSP
ncbi:hypothetical protein [Malonomonas rubra]|uniref:hypothetical protein n=1 Tax=Malonomonas rubra TaxID=57040 RepID=UPI0026F2E6FB|nr:hypothetical protein [Malonomonas rubra]